MNDEEHATWRAAEIARREADRLQWNEKRAGWDRESAEHRAAATARYVDYLADAFDGHTGDDARELARIAVERLLTRMEDGGRECGCSCHPRLPTSDLHDYGFHCPCSATPEERKASWSSLLATMNARNSTPHALARRAAHEAREAELAAWLATQPDVEVTSHGGACLEQWEGSVAGRRFYFRERHGEWTLDFDVVAVPTLRFRGVDDDGAGIYEDDTYDEGVEIASGSEGCPGYGTTPRERAEFIIGHLRHHIADEASEAVR